MNACPACGQPVPANEWTAYHRHEDCSIPKVSTIDNLRTVVRNGVPNDRRRKPCCNIEDGNR